MRMLLREGWALKGRGEENDPAVADADRAEHREAIFGQTCPIETAVDVLASGSGIQNGSIWRRQAGGFRAQSSRTATSLSTPARTRQENGSVLPASCRTFAGIAMVR